jgi:hypothetical protein
MSLNENEFDHVTRIAIEEAQSLDKPDANDDSAWDKYHDVLFGRVLTAIDDSHYSYLDARDVSEACSEVEGDIRYGDILGL